MMELPDSNGYFGKFGGRFVPETLMDALLDLEIQYNKVITQNDFRTNSNNYCGISQDVQLPFILHCIFHPN